MKLIVFHSHFRPGGVRRVIELAAAPLLDAGSSPCPHLVLAGGEAPDAAWLTNLQAQLPSVKISCWIEPALGYLADQKRPPAVVARRARLFLLRHLPNREQDSVVWAHNQSLGRNLILTRELIRHCAARKIPLVLHHHDWWFDNRWQRWPEMRRSGFRSLKQVATTLFAATPNLRHATINRADFAALAPSLGSQSAWLPNLMPRAPRPAAARVEAAQLWLNQVVRSGGDPVWLVPCRLLRRKNLAEALLLARWLRPEAWLVTTGGMSSADERAYFDKLTQTARAHRWRAKFAVLASGETDTPTVSELLAASETLLLTSIQEGFGLPYLEAADARRPLIARSLPNVAPDLTTFGFRFPQSYHDILVPITLFDWKSERRRQRRLFDHWRRALPTALRRQAQPPAALGAGEPSALPFSRLTLTAQLQVLAQPVSESWAASSPLNPFLKVWQRRAKRAALQVTPWPAGADEWLGGKAYANRFFKLLRRRTSSPPPADTNITVQENFLAKTLAASNHYPLLWNRDT